MRTSFRDNATGARRVSAPFLATLLFLAGIAPALAATADANASAGAGLNAGTLINAATVSLNTPAAREAVTQATNVARSPEMQGAVKSFWQTTWDASWPFLSGMVEKFFGLFVTAWQVIARMPSEIDANANANAPTNANVAPTPH